MGVFSRAILSIVYNILGLNPEKYEDERKFLIVIRLVISLIIIVCILCTALFFTKPEFKVWSTGLDADAVLSMKDFGYQDDKDPDAAIFAVTYDTEKAGNLYKLYCSAEEGRKSFEIDVVQLYENTNADEVFKHLVEEKYTSLQKTAIGNRQYMPTVKYERAIEQMEKLDASSWNAEEAYAANASDMTNHQIIFVKRQHEILVLTVHGFELDDVSQKTLLDRISQINIQEDS